MLLYSIILPISSRLTRESFAQLIMRWNNENLSYKESIQDMTWKGKGNAKYGNENLSMTFVDYEKKDILATRYERVEESGVVWDVDCVVSFDEKKMTIQLYKSYRDNTATTDIRFTTPYFINYLFNEGYIENVDSIPLQLDPISINGDSLDILAGVVNRTEEFQFPVIYISKNSGNGNPVNIGYLKNILKGTAHILLQEDFHLTKQCREICNGKNAYHGAVGIYYPGNASKDVRLLYHKKSGNDKELLSAIIKSIFHYYTSQEVPVLLTWDGVHQALLDDKFLMQQQICEDTKDAMEKACVEAELAKKKAKEEVEDVYAKLDDELKHLQEKIEELTRENEVLKTENMAYRCRLETSEKIPLLYYGQEKEIYPGEIKDILLSVVDNAKKGIKENTRRYDVLNDLITSNEYHKTCIERQQKIKELLKSYDNMSKSLRQELVGMGFEITCDGKHYKLTYGGDERYIATLGKTPSDFRAGKNVALIICRNML